MTAVTRHLEARSIPFRRVAHRETLTSIDEARALGIGADEVVKTIVADTDQGHALLVVPASRRLDLKLVRRALGPHAKLASEDELQRDFPDIALGSMPPLGRLVGVPTVVDPEVLRHEVVVFAAGSTTESVIASPEVLFSGDDVRVEPLTLNPELSEEIC